MHHLQNKYFMLHIGEIFPSLKRSFIWVGKGKGKRNGKGEWEGEGGVGGDGGEGREW